MVKYLSKLGDTNVYERNGYQIDCRLIVTNLKTFKTNGLMKYTAAATNRNFPA